jgi:hypothetical protein
MIRTPSKNWPLLILVVMGMLTGCAPDDSAKLPSASPTTVADFREHFRKRHKITDMTWGTDHPSAAVQFKYQGPCNWLEYRYEVWQQGKMVAGTGDAPQGERVDFPADLWFLIFNPDLKASSNGLTRISLQRVSQKVKGDPGRGSGGGASFEISVPPDIAAQGIKRIDLPGPVTFEANVPLCLWAFVPEEIEPSPGFRQDPASAAHAAEWGLLITATLVQK